jgi:hypothetical protein
VQTKKPEEKLEENGNWGRLETYLSDTSVKNKDTGRIERAIVLKPVLFKKRRENK